MVAVLAGILRQELGGQRWRQGAKQPALPPHFIPTLPGKVFAAEKTSARRVDRIAGPLLHHSSVFRTKGLASLWAA